MNTALGAQCPNGAFLTVSAHLLILAKAVVNT